MERKPYPSDVSDEEWAFVSPYLVLMDEQAKQRRYPLREVFNAMRWIVRAGAPWRLLPNDLPPWQIVYQQTSRWLSAGCFEAMVHDLRVLLRLAAGRAPQPTAAILDSRTLQSTPESGQRGGYDGAKRRKGSKLHLAVDTLGHLLALHVTPATEQDRAQVGQLAQAVQEVTGEQVELAYVDQGYTGEAAQEQAAAQGIELEVVKHPATTKGFVLLPRRWVVERSFAWTARFRRLARDYERLPQTLAGLHLVAFATLMLAKAIPLLQQMPNTLYRLNGQSARMRFAPAARCWRWGVFGCAAGACARRVCGAFWWPRRWCCWPSPSRWRCPSPGRCIGARCRARVRTALERFPVPEYLKSEWPKSAWCCPSAVTAASRA
jgi:transposase